MRKVSYLAYSVTRVDILGCGCLSFGPLCGFGGGGVFGEDGEVESRGLAVYMVVRVGLAWCVSGGRMGSRVVGEGLGWC